jgi:hypothetical protein
LLATPAALRWFSSCVFDTFKVSAISCTVRCQSFKVFATSRLANVNHFQLKHGFGRHQLLVDILYAAHSLD